MTGPQMEGVMGRTALRIAGLAVLVGALHVPAAHADTRFSFHVGVGTPVPPVVVVPAPVYAAPYYGYYASYDDYYWVPAYRVWGGYGYRWVPGRWARRDFRRWERDYRGRGRGHNRWR
jgi:hypothetical protein